MSPRLAVLLALVTACTINERSADYTCTVQADCTGGRTCSSGLCVAGGMGSNGCPTACTSCDAAAKTCAIEGGNTVTCPTGWSCFVTCSRTNSCDKVDCDGATSCTVTCSGVDSCKELRCRTGRCNVACSGQGSCDTVDCQDACACDVSCAQGACNAKPVCPMNVCSTPTGCSSILPACNGC